MAFIVKAGPTGRGELYYFYMFMFIKYFLGVGYVMLFMLPGGWEGVKLLGVGGMGRYLFYIWRLYGFYIGLFTCSFAVAVGWGYLCV